MTCVKQESNKILLQGRNKNRTRLWQKNVPKISVEQIKGNVINANVMGFIFLNVHLWLVMNLYIIFSLILVHF
jgi:hypothetical protein